MKKLLTPLGALLLLALAACSSGAKLSFTPKEGETRTLKTSVTSTITARIANQNMTASTIREMDWEFVVKGKDAAGTALEAKLVRSEVRVTPEGAELPLGLGGGITPALLKRAVKSQEGTLLNIKLSHDGQIQSLGDIFTLPEQALDRAKVPEGAERTAMLQLLRDQMNAYQLETAMTAITRHCHPEPLNPGDSWTEVEYLNTGIMPMKCDTTRTLKSVSGDKAIVESVYTFSGDQETNIGGVTLKLSPTGSINETLTADTESGWAENIEGNGTLSLRLNTPVGTALTIEVKVVETSTITPGGAAA